MYARQLGIDKQASSKKLAGRPNLVLVDKPTKQITPFNVRVTVVEKPLTPAEHQLVVDKPVTRPTAEALEKVARWKKEQEAKKQPKPVQKTKVLVVHRPHFEPGTPVEEKIEALQKVGFVQIGMKGENPLYAHPANPADFLPFELYMPKAKPIPRRMEKPRRSTAEMLKLAPKPLNVEIDKNGRVVVLPSNPPRILSPAEMESRRREKLKAKAKEEEQTVVPKKEANSDEPRAKSKGQKQKNSSGQRNGGKRK